MPILDDIIKSLETDDLTEQVKRICKMIHDEEIKNCKYIDKLPEGPNTFLSVEVPGIRKNQFSYLSLEREAEERYLTVLWSMQTKFYKSEDMNPLKIKTWEINENKTEKILTQFAKKVKLLRGE